MSGDLSTHVKLAIVKYLTTVNDFCAHFEHGELLRVSVVVYSALVSYTITPAWTELGRGYDRYASVNHLWARLRPSPQCDETPDAATTVTPKCNGL